MDVGLSDIYGFTDYLNDLENNVFDEKIDDMLSVDIAFDKYNDIDIVYESAKSISQPVQYFSSDSAINPNDFLNDVEVEDAFNFSDRSSPPVSSNSSSSLIDNLKHESGSASDGDSVNLESPPLNNHFVPATATTLFPNDSQFRILQGALIPVSAIKIETRQSRISPNQSISFVSNNFFREATKTKTVLPKQRLPAGQNAEAAQKLTMTGEPINDRALKKQQRMIKNRESASLSRRKKKEYVVSLEKKIKSLLAENSVLKNENVNFRAQLSSMSGMCPCRTSQFSYLNKNMSSLQNRKNTAILLAMIFMVSMSFGNFNTFFSSRNETSKEDLSINLGPHVGRGLLWANDLPSVDDDSLKNVTNDVFKSVVGPICPFSVNQTENIRISNQLRNWIGVSDNLNSTQHDEDPFNYMPDFNIFKPNIRNLYSKKKNPHSNTNPSVLSLKKRFAAPSVPARKNKNQMQLFNPTKRKRRFSKLFEEIGRRDDTFYVLSFKSDHLLLSAAINQKNQSARPKISFVLPADDSFLNGKMTLMQIDCEVINTTVIQLKKEFIPDHLRTQPKEQEQVPRNNTTYKVRNKFEIFEMVGQRVNRKAEYNKIYKPYFMDKPNFARTSGGDFSDVFIP